MARQREIECQSVDFSSLVTGLFEGDNNLQLSPISLPRREMLHSREVSGVDGQSEIEYRIKGGDVAGRFSVARSHLLSLAAEFCGQSCSPWIIFLIFLVMF